MMKDLDFIQGLFFVITTEEDQEKASKLANILLEKKLIACVSFNNIESCFWWEGEIQESREVQLIFKCCKQHIKKVCENIIKNHSYQVPEIAYYPVTINKSYYKWASFL